MLQKQKLTFPLWLSSSVCVAQAVILPDNWKLGYPDGPEMNDYKLQLQQFVSEWEQMRSSLPASHSILEISSETPEDLLKEMIHQMESVYNPLKS